MSVYLVSDDIYYNFSKKINKSRNIHGGSHELLLFICRILLGFHKVKKNRYMNIDAKIKSLKSDRAIATYTKDEITDDELQDILDAANNTIARVEELEQDLQSKQAKNRLHKIEDYNYITKFEWSVENNKGKTDYIYL